MWDIVSVLFPAFVPHFIPHFVDAKLSHPHDHLQLSTAPVGTFRRNGNTYEQVVWVYRAINVLAEQVANMPFRFSHGRTGAEDIITSGPLYDFYERPHPLLNGFRYWEQRNLLGPFPAAVAPYRFSDSTEIPEVAFVTVKAKR